MDERPVIAVIGGGTAGWLAACHIAKMHCPRKRVLLIEDPDVPAIGVGEGTVPAFRESLRYLGVSESDLVQHCDATFKQSIKFIGWKDNPDSNGRATEYYHHLFDYPFDPENAVAESYGSGCGMSDASYAEMVSIQAQLCDAGFAPKTIAQPEFEGVASYAYHFDAAKFSNLLYMHGTESLGVEYLSKKCVGVTLDGGGNIAQVKLAGDESLDVSFVVDATGFACSILGQELKVPFLDKSKFLFVDSAIVTQLEYSSPAADIPCFTIATAQPTGWVWDIGLSNRRGIGHVYSSSHCSDACAMETFERYVGDDVRLAEARKIPMRIGYREKFWVGNCAAIGLAQGFVEPLEATGLLMFDATSRLLAQLMPDSKDILPAASSRFNARVRHAWDSVIDFIKLHYCLSTRTDTEFWNDNRLAETMPQSLSDLLQMWQERIPVDADFGDAFGIFHKPNYNYVLFGMQGREQLRKNLKPDLARMMSHQQKVKSRFQAVASGLDGHKTLIEKIKRYGLQKV